MNFISISENMKIIKNLSFISFSLSLTFVSTNSSLFCKVWMISFNFDEYSLINQNQIKKWKIWEIKHETWENKHEKMRKQTWEMWKINFNKIYIDEMKNEK